MKRFLQGLLSPLVLGSLGLLALSAVVWWVGPLLAIGDARPLDGVVVRLVVIVLLWAAWIGRLAWVAWRRKRANAALLAGLGEVMRSPDENGQDKLNDLYRKIISLPERAKTAKTLAETLRIAVDMERQAFGMDAKGADGATPGAAGYVPPSIRVVHVTAPVRQEDDDAGD